MKLRLIITTIVFGLCVILLLPNLGNSQHKDNDSQLKGLEIASTKLITLTKKGLIKMDWSEPDSFIMVEPLYWKNLLHNDK